MKWINWTYPKGGLAFMLGDTSTVYNVRRAIGFMGKKSFYGILLFTDPKTYDMIADTVKPAKED